MKIIISIFFFLTAGCIPVIGQTDQLVSPSEKNPKAVELIKQAILLEDAMMLAGAIAIYKEVLKREPKDFAAMNTIAGIYGKQGDAEQAIIWAHKAVDTNPRFWQGYINLGNGLAMQNRIDVATKAFQKAAEIAPKNSSPIYSLGVVAENQLDFQKALALYKKSIELDPKYENGLFSAAAMHANLKQFAEAKVLLNKLLELNPKAEDARQMLRQIERERP